MWGAIRGEDVMKILLPVLLILMTMGLMPLFAVSETVEKVMVRGDRPSIKFQGHSFLGESREAEDMVNQEASGVGEVLESLPGVTTTGGPRHFLETPQIRGMSGDKVLLMIDGTKQNYRSHHSGGPNIDPTLLKRVDVVKSSSSTRHGSGAMGGVVSYTTKDASDFLKTGANFGGKVSTSFHSGNNEQKKSLTLAGSEGKISKILHIQKRESQDIKQGGSDQKKLPYSGTDDFYLYTKIGYQIDREGRLSFSYDRLKNRYIIPFGDAALILFPNAITGVSHDEVTRETSTLKYSRTKEKDNIELSLYHTALKSSKIRSTDNRIDERELSSSGIDFSQKKGFKPSFLSLPFSLLWGGDFLYEDQVGTRNGEYLSSYPNGIGYIGGGFIELGLPVYKEKGAVTAGVRYDGYKQKSASINHGEKKGDNFSKSLKGEMNLLNDFLFHLSYTEGFNVPRLEQLFPSGYHFNSGTTNNFVPNPDLKPERAKHYEAGVKFQRELLTNDDLITLSFQAYQKDVDDYIEPYLSLLRGTTQFTNLDFVRFRGQEIGLSYDFSFLSFYARYERVRAKKKNGHYLSKAPADEMSWGVIAYGAQKKYRMGYEGKQAMDQHRLDPEDQEPIYQTNRYITHNVFLSCSCLKDLEIVFRINNLFNSRYRKHTAYNYEMGRDARLGVSYLF